MARKPSDTVQLKLRFSETLRRRLAREARRHGQSLNSEIVSILEERFRESADADRRAADFADGLRDEFMRMAREAREGVPPTLYTVGPVTIGPRSPKTEDDGEKK
jgi:hypothetical protein